MPTVNVNFDTFSSSGSFGQVPWSSADNAETANGVYTTAALSSSSTTTELLICTDADLSSIPATAAIQSVKLVIKGKCSANNSAQIFEIFAYDGSTTQGRNQGVSWTGSDDDNTNEIDLDTSNTLYKRGAAGWKWWWLSRLQTSGNGVAIRAKWLAGTPTVEIDHVQFEITYLELFQKWPVVDYRTIAYDRVAGGTGDDTDENENDQPYQPTKVPFTLKRWHDQAEDFLNDLIALRTGQGIKRLVLGTPAGRWLNDTSNLVPSAQWETLFNDQRVALAKVIPNWLKGDPEREAIVYLGTKVPTDPNDLTMVGAVDPDVTNTTHTEKLKRTFFPYRDLVGIRRFLLDNSSVIFQSGQDFREKREAFFAWGREEGMEFVMEAIPHTGADLHEEITEVYGAYALAGLIIGDDTRSAQDEDLEWDFTKGRLLVQVNSKHFAQSTIHDFSTDEGKRRFFQQFAREGYVLMPRDKAGGIDDAAEIVGSEHIGRGVSFGASSSVSFGVANSVTRFVEGSRKRS